MLKTESADMYADAYRPVVLTSINPKGDLTWQKHCVYSFTNSGHDVFSFNNQAESDLISDLGLPITAVVIEDVETGSKDYNKPLPLILSVLKRAAKLRHRKYFLLTNSDVYYSGSRPCSQALHRRSPCFALTRNEISDPHYASWTNEAPYRGGLDTFGFTLNSLNECIETIARDMQSATKLAFGIPGWDFFVGSLILTSLRGFIADGPIFAHRIHRQTYTSPSALQPYIRRMAELGVVDVADVTEAAHQFSTRIITECNKNQQISRFLSLAYGLPANIIRRSLLKSYRVNKALIESQAEFHLLNISSQLFSETVSVFAARQFDVFTSYCLNHGCNYITPPVAEFATSGSFLVRTRQLICLGGVIIVSLVSESSCLFTEKYPPGNSHKAAVHMYSKVNQPQEQNYRLAELFYTELIEYHIFNSTLFQFVASGVDDKRYRHLLILQSKLIYGALTSG